MVPGHGPRSAGVAALLIDPAWPVAETPHVHLEHAAMTGNRISGLPPEHGSDVETTLVSLSLTTQR